jgi:L-asparaginase II
MQAHIYSYRGNLIENRHTASIAIVNPSGKLLAYAGDPTLASHLRSSAKPFQAQALFLTGAARHFGLTPKEIAISCASHAGGLRHVETVAGYLKKIGLNPEHLACGAHMPFDKENSQLLRQSREEPTVLHSNCSGKHCGMLAASLALGADPHGYEQAGHPVQQINFQTLRDLACVQEIPFGIDGCSVPAFVLPLVAAARMFAQLAQPDAAPPKYQDGLETAYTSMRAHPEMVSGVEQMDTVLMSHLPNFASKGGADGYYGLAVRKSKHGPLGIALKVESGSSEARDPLVIKLLEQLGVLSPELPLPWRKPLVRNVRKLEVGWFDAQLELSWVTTARP